MDVFRKEYKPLNEIQIVTVTGIKSLAEDLYKMLDECPCEHDNRGMAIARIKLEESVMWATKAVTG